MMHISDRGTRFIKTFEKFRATSYQDEGGVWTVGYGDTGAQVKEGTTVTEAEAFNRLKIRVKQVEVSVNHSVSVVINQDQFDAMVSLAYNIGRGAFEKSSVCHFTNMKYFELAANSFALFNKVRGKVSNGLAARRDAEAQVYRGLWHTEGVS